MRIPGLPELRHYRGPTAWLRALAIVLWQLRVTGLVLPPWLLGLAAGSLIALTLAPAVLQRFGSHPAIMIGYVAATNIWLVSVLCIPAVVRARSAWRRDLIRHGVQICLRCGRDAGQEDVQQCPSCSADMTDLLTRAWEPPPIVALYPDLLECRTREEAMRTLAAAQARAGVLFLYRHLTLGLILVGLLIFWIIVFNIADRIAYRQRVDLPAWVKYAIMTCAIVSMPLAASAWYGLVLARVRTEIRLALTGEPT